MIPTGHAECCAHACCVACAFFFYLIRERKTLEVLEQIKSRVGMMAHFMPFSPAGEFLAFTHVGVRVD